MIKKEIERLLEKQKYMQVELDKQAKQTKELELLDSAMDSTSDRCINKARLIEIQRLKGKITHFVELRVATEVQQIRLQSLDTRANIPLELVMEINGRYKLMQDMVSQIYWGNSDA